MRTWRKLYSSFLESPDVAKLSDSAALLLTFLIAAQDDTGYYPWEPLRVRRVTLTRTSWSHDVATQYAQEIVDAGIAVWEGNGLLLVNGTKLNGKPRKDVEIELYARSQHVDATSTPRNDTASQREQRDLIRAERAEVSGILDHFTPQDIASLKAKFPGIDLEYEAGKCRDWWAEGKKPMKRPKVSFKNWLERAWQKQQRETINAIPGDDREKYRRGEEDRNRRRAILTRQRGLPTVQEAQEGPPVPAALPGG